MLIYCIEYLNITTPWTPWTCCCNSLHSSGFRLCTSFCKLWGFDSVGEASKSTLNSHQSGDKTFIYGPLLLCTLRNCHIELESGSPVFLNCCHEVGRTQVLLIYDCICCSNKNYRAQTFKNNSRFGVQMTYFRPYGAGKLILLDLDDGWMVNR